MWLRIGLITSAAEVAWPWSVKSGKITKVLDIRIILVLVLVIVTKISLIVTGVQFLDCVSLKVQ